MEKNLSMEQVEALALEKWNADADLRAEFADQQEAYMAYVRAEARGLVRILSGNVVRVRGKGVS